MLGTDKIENIAEALKKLVIAGKKIKADGKVGIDDIGVVVALVSDASFIINAFKEFDVAFEQGKDIDVAEAIALIQLINKKIKEIEVA